MKHPRTEMINVRFTVEELNHIREIVKANTGTISEFVRTCVNTSLAQAGDPEATKMLEAMFQAGMQDFVNRRVKEEVAKAKGGTKRKK